MTPDWIDEGIRQLQLALLWSRLAEYQSSRAQAMTTSTSQIDGVVELLLSHEWMPDIRERTKKIVKKRIDIEIANKTCSESESSAPTLPDSLFLHRLEDKVRYALAPFQDEQAKSAETTDSRMLAIEAIRWAANSALQFRDQPAEPPTARGGRTKPAPLGLSSAEAARAWLAEGQALAEWDQLRQQIEAQQQAEAHFARVTPLARECLQIGNWLADWCSGQFAFGPFLSGTGPIRERLRDASRYLLASHQALTRLKVHDDWPSQADQHARSRHETLQQIRATLQKAPENWPPRLLAGFQADLDKLGPEGPGPILAAAADVRLPTVEGATPWALVVLALADKLVAHKPASSAAWDQLEQLAVRLLGEPGARVQVLREASQAAAHTDAEESLSHNAPPELRRAGLVVRHGDRVEVIRKAAVAIAQPRPRAAALCRQVAASLRVPGGPAATADLFVQVAEELDKHRDLGSWWKAAAAEPELESLGRFWQAVQRAASLAADRSSPAAAAAADLLGELTRTDGVSFVEPDPEIASRRTGLWLLTAEGDGPHPTPLDGTTTLALRGPDGLVFQPAGWINVPAAWRTESPILQALIDAQPLLTGLRARQPDWPGWVDVEGAGWDLVHSRPDRTRGGHVDADRAVAAFTKAYERSRGPEDRWCEPFRELARRLYVGLKQSGVTFFPDLDDDTLEPRPLAGPPPAGTKIEWVVANSAPGTYVVVRPGIGRAPAELRYSLGPEPPTELLTWLDWMQHVAKPAPGREPAQVGLLRENLPKLLRIGLDQAIETHESLRQQFRMAAEGEGDEGRSRFDEIARSQDPALAALREVLTKTAWCEIWPKSDPATGHWRWPEGLSVASTPAARWSAVSALPLGRAVADGGARYAPCPELIEGEFSLGTPAAGSPLAAVVALRDGQAPETLREPIRAIFVAELDRALGNPSPDDPSVLLGPLLDGLTAAVSAHAESASTLDCVLRRARDWARSRGIEVQPACWSFSEPPSIDRLRAEGCDVDPPRFGGTGADAGRPRLVAFGWQGAAHAPRRPTRVETFAGPAPPHYDDLLKLLTEDASLPGRDRMLMNLSRWPGYLANDDPSYRYDRDALFDDFWRATAEVPRTKAIQEAEILLTRLLTDGFGLQIYQPRDTQSHAQDEYQVVARGDRKTGRVRQVRRPGLKGPEGVRFPAEIELE